MALEHWGADAGQLLEPNFHEVPLPARQEPSNGSEVPKASPAAHDLVSSHHPHLLSPVHWAHVVLERQRCKGQVVGSRTQPTVPP